MRELRLPCLCSIACAFLSVASAAGQANQRDPTVPPSGQKVILTVQGRGVQIYVCRQAGDVPTWVFVAPEATLQNGTGAEVGSHGAGPVWSLKDGSSVRGRVVAQEASPLAGAIPWLLLESVQPKGPGVLGGARYIRRSETRGGVADALGCDGSQLESHPGSHLGASVRVPYTATYTFYGDRPQ